MVRPTTHDARLSSVFSSALLDDSGLPAVTTLAPNFSILQAQPCEQIHRLELLSTVAVTNPTSGAYVFDLGQNHAGLPIIQLAGQPAGTTVQVCYGEDLKADSSGTLYTANLRNAAVTDHFTARGAAIEKFEPLHVYHGYRHVEVTGYVGTPPLSTVSSSPVSTELRVVGNFSCSNATMNAIWTAMFWTDRSNSMSTYTDCPQRDERLGWDDVAQLCARTGMFFRDRQAYMRKYLQDLIDSASAGSGIASLVPYVNVATHGQAGWADAASEVAWALYQVYGDTERLTAVLAVFKAQNLLAALPWGNSYNDYLAPATDANVFTYAWAYRTASIMNQIATVLGDSTYAGIAASAAAGFLSTWQGYIASDGTINGDTQTAYLLGFTFGMIPSAKVSACLGKLVANINANGLVVGLCGVTMWFDVLANNGQLALAYPLAQSTAAHSIAYTLTRGGTTLSEQWDTRSIQGQSIDVHGQVQSGQADNAHSMNHSSRGPICGWFMRTVAGIDLDPAAPGYANVIKRPRPDSSTTYADGTFDGPRGRIESHWSTNSKGMLWSVIIPANSTATITLPPAYTTAKVAGADVSTIGTAATADPITGVNATPCLAAPTPSL